jgi:hypothetical protein
MSLDPTRNAELSTDQIEANITLAKKVAREAVYGEESDSETGFDFRNTGVRQAPSGNWSVQIKYYGSQRSIGTFDTQDEAALANEAARRILEPTRNAELSTEQIEANVTLAKEAAQMAV